MVAACHRASTHFSITTGMNLSIKRAIATIPDHAWRPIRYPGAVVDPDTGELISDAEAAETSAYTAFTGRKKAEQITARLIVRRVRDLAKPPPSVSRASCSPSGATTRSSPTAPSRPSRPNGSTATTR